MSQTGSNEEAVAETAASPTGRRGRDGGERRRIVRHLHFPERRTGFDRRRRYPITGALSDNPRALFWVLVAINLLSAIDFALTFLQLEAGIAEEANVLLAQMFVQSPGQAWLFKTSVVLLVSLAIWHQRRHRSILAVAAGTLVLYIVLVCYHLVGMRASGLL